MSVCKRAVREQAEMISISDREENIMDWVESVSVDWDQPDAA